MEIRRIKVRMRRKCGCPPGTRPQEYTNQVVLDFPYGVTRKQVCVDRCLADEVQGLWDLGIVTTGCCCGHHDWYEMRYIGVRDEHIPAMKALGYAVQYNPMRPGDEDSFVPKSV